MTTGREIDKVNIRRLRDPRVLSAVAARAEVTHAGGPDFQTRVQQIILHNTAAVAIVVDVWLVPAAAGAVGVAADANKVARQSIPADDTYVIDESVIGSHGLILEDTNDTVQMLAGAAGVTVTCNGERE